MLVIIGPTYQMKLSNAICFKFLPNILLIIFENTKTITYFFTLNNKKKLFKYKPKYYTQF